MVYYSVLKKIIEQPKTDKELIQSILGKASSIVKEYGLEHVMEHNEDHYFDIDNNEIIVLNFKPIINKAASNVRECSIYYDKIYYNYTKNKYTVYVKNPKYESMDYDCPRSVSISELSNDQLVELDKQLCCCEEAKRYSVDLLNSVIEKVKNNKFIKGYFYQIYCVTGKPYIKDVDVIGIPIAKYSYGSYEGGKYLKEKEKNSVLDVKSSDDIELISKDKLVNLIFEESNTGTSMSLYKKTVKEAEKIIKSYTLDIEVLNNDLNNGVFSKTETLKKQLKIAELEEEIETRKKFIEETKQQCKKAEKEYSSKKQEIIDFIDSFDFKKYTEW